MHVSSDPWLLDILFNKCPTFINMDIATDGLLISDLITSSREWNDDYIAIIFVPYLISKIHYMLLSHGGWPDLLVWHHSK